MNPVTILHITPHLGGGVGRVLLNYLSKVKNDSRCFHQVACLDYSNDDAIKKAKSFQMSLLDNMSENKSKLLDLITKADIVLIHWWNHPLLYDFLVRTILPPCRIAMWSHISGFHPPYVFTQKILVYADLFVLTTPVSKETKEIINLTEIQKEQLRVVWSTGGVEHVKNVISQPHEGFNIGYIGTVDYCKMHPDFLKMCSLINIPAVNFIVCGGPNERELKHEAEDFGIGSKFNCTGLISDITKYLAIFDIFGYPLAPYHYGTCDQVLAESMAAGIVPVVLSNRMENQMVQDGVTGIVAHNVDEYVNAIKKLYINQDFRNRLSKNAKNYATATFSLEKIKHEWDAVFEELLLLPKTTKQWENNGRTNSGITAKDVFLESLGDYGQEFVIWCNAKTTVEKNKYIEKLKELGKTPLWRAKTRGTVHHYAEFFSGRYVSCTME